MLLSFDNWAYGSPTKDPHIVLKIPIRSSRNVMETATSILQLDFRAEMSRCIQEEIDRLYELIYERDNSPDKSKKVVL